MLHIYDAELMLCKGKLNKCSDTSYANTDRQLGYWILLPTEAFHQCMGLSLSWVPFPPSTLNDQSYLEIPIAYPLSSRDCVLGSSMHVPITFLAPESIHGAKSTSARLHYIVYIIFFLAILFFTFSQSPILNLDTLIQQRNLIIPSPWTES